MNQKSPIFERQSVKLCAFVLITQFMINTQMLIRFLEEEINLLQLLHITGGGIRKRKDTKEVSRMSCHG